VILITTARTSLSGTIPTEIGQLTSLGYLHLGKCDGYSRSFHALFFIFQLTTCAFYLFCGTGENELTGQIPIELQTIPLYDGYPVCFLREYRAFSPPAPFPFVLRLQGFSHTLAIVIIHNRIQLL
jgi:hypothetical protein